LYVKHNVEVIYSSLKCKLKKTTTFLYTQSRS